MLFPGQGAQAVGMGRALAESSATPAVTGSAWVAVTLRLAAVMLPPTCASMAGDTVAVASETPTASPPADTPKALAVALGVSVAATTIASPALMLAAV